MEGFFTPREGNERCLSIPPTRLRLFFWFGCRLVPQPLAPSMDAVCLPGTMAERMTGRSFRLARSGV